jgi:alpha-tubulin suppressor-like RCC1 family protein
VGVSLVNNTQKMYRWGRAEEIQANVLSKGFGCEISLSNIKSKIREIKSGGLHNLIVTEDGSLFSFGVCDVGQLGRGNEVEVIVQPQRVMLLNQVLSMSAGIHHALALVKDTEKVTIYSWGNNKFGRAAQPKIANFSLPTIIPSFRNKQPNFYNLVEESERNFSAISAGVNHSLFLREDGALFACGDASGGATGLTSKLKGIFQIPYKLKSFGQGKKVVQIKAGSQTSFALVKNI